MRKAILIGLTCVVSMMLVGCNSTTRIQENTVTNKEHKLAPGITLPLQQKVAVYMPSSFLATEFVLSGNIQKPGRAVTEATESLFNNYYSSFSWFEPGKQEQASLVFKVHPKWEVDGNKIVSEMAFTVFDRDGNALYSDVMTGKSTFNRDQLDAGFYNASYNSMLGMLVNFTNKHSVEIQQLRSGDISRFDLEKLIDDKPKSTGTGFFVNKEGDIVTAAHVINQCLLAKVKVDDNEFIVSPNAKSDLLDLAVISSNTPRQYYLNQTSAESLPLGSKITLVSYPLNGLLETSPNITFGNITSVKGLAGSKGIFQFSAPIQPGSSGGALVSEQGEVMGVTTSTLNIASLVKRGVIPQNVNFATSPQILKKFLKKNNIPFSTRKNSTLSPTELALKSSAPIACYQ
ncbi:Serine endoprotease DegS [Grimontia celer]|uniref:Serine endoprotease DegS n=1 Tax=Grimontia celer TaxID=1796497 RepID=A0A128EXT8_9GAMM|nr:serine protease [Grimontia celer]CZF79403.1 Serine endoprotease DegS [Grimontia celer]